MKAKCSNCGKFATYSYMPGKEYYCYDCLPKGCSCNNESFFEEEIEEQKKEYIEKIENGEKYFLLDFGSIQMHYGKETKITDKEEILNKLRTGNVLHFLMVPLDENGNEYPCCEYFQDSEGFELYNEK